MIAAQLKKAILQAAVEGKLTEQKVEDGNAGELLEQIKQEKEGLVKEKKIKKEKPLPAISADEIPFEIPDNWCWVRLGTIIFNRGQKKPNERFTYIDISSIDNKNHQLGSLDSIMDAKEAPSRARKIVEKGDVIYATVRPYLQNTCIIDRSILPKPIVSTGFAVLSTPYVQMNIYLFRYLLSPMFDSYANDTENAKGVAYPAINDSKFNNALVPLPPLAEQERIVKKIEELLSHITELEKDEKRLKALQDKFPDEMKKSLLQAAIEGKLSEQKAEDGNASELLVQIKQEKEKLVKEKKIKKEKPLPAITADEIPFEIPKNWCWVRLGEIGDTNIGLTYKPNEISSDGIIVLRSGNIQQGKIDYNDVIKVTTNIPQNKLCHVGDLLICARNGSKRLVGKAAIIDKEGMTFGAFMAIFKSKFNRYVYFYLNSNYFRSDFDGVSTTTINQITQDNLRNRLIPLPPLAEQERIAARLEEMLPICEELKKQ